MRKEVGLVFVFILFGFSLVAAASCSDGSQIIMKLYDVSNSHVSAWDESPSYTEEICYDDIFGFEYSGSDPHDCTGENEVLFLHDSSNSHASEVSDANYDYDVCYGALSWDYESGADDSCSNEGKVVVRMSATTNAHVAVASDGDYLIKVCCSTASLYWANINGDEITDADIGDTVYLVGRGILSGDFEIWDEDAIADDYIRDVSGASGSFGWVGVWTIDNADLAAADDVGEGFDGFYFKIAGKESERLTVSESGDDDPLELTIVSPPCGAYFDEGVDLGIVINASDSDDIIKGSVKINGVEEFTFSNGMHTFNRVFGAGNFQILAEAVGEGRGGEKRMISNIMVLEKSGAVYVDRGYVAACIDSPEDFTNIPGNEVEFDVSSTRGIRVVGGVLDLLIPAEGDSFSWYWTFYPEGSTRNFVNSSVVGGVGHNGYNFNAYFPIAGVNSATLRVEV
jgi:hypothetical protein